VLVRRENLLLDLLIKAAGEHDNAGKD
jgi:hypothetical protein